VISTLPDPHTAGSACLACVFCYLGVPLVIVIGIMLVALMAKAWWDLRRLCKKREETLARRKERLQKLEKDATNDESGEPDRAH